MKIERSRLMTLGEFAELHDLTIVVRRVADRKYEARFKDVCVYCEKECVPVRGEGDTEVKAIIDYAEAISCERISTREDLEVDVPNLIAEWR